MYGQKNSSYRSITTFSSKNVENFVTCHYLICITIYIICPPTGYTFNFFLVLIIR